MNHHKHTALSRIAALVAGAFVLIAAACGNEDGATPTTATAPPTTTEPADTSVSSTVADAYADDANWLCKPGSTHDVCDRDLDATAVFADGSTEVRPHVRAESPPVDCFYVYPTVSLDNSPNSDLETDAAEENNVWEVARLTAACRVFAPVYRQVTVTQVIADLEAGNDLAEEWPEHYEIAYGDVLAAFRHYIANENRGRGFVLVGHSQGSNMLIRLIAEEIDREPTLRDRLVSALLLGWAVGVPDGGSVGGDFQNVPLCHSVGDTGCVVSYSSFRSTSPPPPDSLYGHTGPPLGRGTGRAACVNPAALEGGSATAQPYFLLTDQSPFADETRASEITTRWVTYPDFIEVECVDDGTFSYLEVTVNADSEDPRADDIPGDLIFGGRVLDKWGLHLVDVPLTIGDLIDVVTTQAENHDREG